MLRRLSEIVYLVVAFRFFRALFGGAGLVGFRRDRLAFALGRNRAYRLVSNNFSDRAIDHGLELVLQRHTDELPGVVFLRQPRAQLGRVSSRKRADLIGRGEHFA